MRQIHILRSLRQKNMVFGCSFAVYCCFLQDSAQFLAYISKILVETIISDLKLSFCRESNIANPYFQQFKTKKLVFGCFFLLFFCCFLLFLADSKHFLSFISNILVETIIYDINVRYCEEENDANPYFSSLRQKSMVFCSFLLFSCCFFAVFLLFFSWFLLFFAGFHILFIIY